MTNQVFIDDPNELSRLLRKLANQLEQTDWEPHEVDHGVIIELNGNKVGDWKIIND